jgi:hypothetical protein
MPEPSPRPAPQPPGPPGFVELFESSLTALADRSAFRRAAARPCPSFGASAGLALAAGGASLAINLTHAFISSPGLLTQFSPAILAAIGAAALGLYACMLLVLSIMLYGIGNAVGGKGGFERGVQAAAMISVLGPVQMLCNWFPFAWILPALLAAWAAAGALEGLFNARPAPARALCAALAAGAIGLQFVGRTVADRARDAYAATRAMSETAGSSADLARSLSEIQQQAAAAGAQSGTEAPAIQTSGLDLLRLGGAAVAAVPVGSAEPAGPADRMPAGTPASMEAAAQALKTNAAGMLDALGPMLDMLANSNTTTPQQKADMKELKNLVSDLKGQLASGRRLDDAAFNAKMARYQQLMMHVMAGSLALPRAGAAQPAAKKSAIPSPPQDGR